MMCQPELNRLAERCPALAGARSVRQLSDGASARSWLIDSRAGQLVLRKDKPFAASLLLDRENEFEVMKAVFAADTGPEPIWLSNDEGILLYRFLEGVTPGPDAWGKRSDIARLAELLRRVHAIEVKAQVFEPVRIARQYEHLAGDKTGTECLARVERRAMRTAETGEAVLCHRDPHSGNIIDNGRLRLIDWEYASLGDPLFDLAVIGHFEQFSQAQLSMLLDEYFGGHGPEHQEAFQLQYSLYEALEQCWTLAIHSNFQPG